MKHEVVCLVIGLLACVPPTRAQDSFNIIVACDMTDAGRKIVRPTPDRPAYYIGVFRGYADQGKSFGEGDPETAPLPSPERIKRLVTDTLASQCYLPAPVPGVVGASPALFINVYWGFISHSSLPSLNQFTLHPHPKESFVETDEFEAPPSPELLDLIGVKHRNSQAFEYGQSASASRYYVILDAYDYATYATSRKRLRLWRTKMSIPAFNLTLAQTVEPMLQAGAAALGKAIYEPLTIPATLLPPGKVVIGKPYVVGSKP